MRGTTIASDHDYIPATATIKPTRDRIFIKPLDFEPSKTIATVRHGRPVRGLVVAVGPGCYRKEYSRDRSKVRETNVFMKMEVKVGDIVELGGLNIYDGKGYNFPEVTIGTEKHLIIQEQDVCGVVNGQS